jgi:hypothetical protein
VITPAMGVSLVGCPRCTSRVDGPQKPLCQAIDVSGSPPPQILNTTASNTAMKVGFGRPPEDPPALGAMTDQLSGRSVPEAETEYCSLYPAYKPVQGMRRCLFMHGQARRLAKTPQRTPASGERIDDGKDRSAREFPCALGYLIKKTTACGVETTECC